MDISMPHADGYEVARRLSAIAEVGPNVSYIALTGFGQPSDMQRSQEAGFAHHLVKPVDPNQLDQILKQTLLGRGEDNPSPAT
jgi:two-component system CheB/CheR fusion protein